MSESGRWGMRSCNRQTDRRTERQSEYECGTYNDAGRLDIAMNYAERV